MDFFYKKIENKGPAAARIGIKGHAPLSQFLNSSFILQLRVVDLFTNEDLKGEGFFEWLGHPGYVDWNLMQLSSLTLGRCLDAHCFCSPAIKEWIKENNIELITYRDLPKR